MLWSECGNESVEELEVPEVELNLEAGIVHVELSLGRNFLHCLEYKEFPDSHGAI